MKTPDTFSFIVSEETQIYPTWWNDTVPEGRSKRRGNGAAPRHDWAAKVAAPEFDPAWVRALENLADGVIVFDATRPHHPLSYVSHAFGALTGGKAVNLVGRELASLFIADEGSDAIACLRAALRERRRWSGEMRLACVDGCSRWCDIRCEPLDDSFGGVRHALIMVTDISARKELECRVRQAQKMSALGWLTGEIAHDFNNVLTAISGYCQMLLVDPPFSIQREGIEEIERLGQRGAQLTRQLLGYCRGKPETPLVQDLASIIVDLERLFRRTLGEPMELVTRIETGLGAVKTLPGQIEQVLFNLVGNARDAMPHGGTITIEVGNRDYRGEQAGRPPELAPGHYVVLSVIDTGCGMTPDMLGKLFLSPFTTKEPGKGTGLGLFSVHEIVEQNGGAVRVSSHPGLGSRFDVYLPRYEKAASESAGSSEQSPRGAA